MFYRESLLLFTLSEVKPSNLDPATVLVLDLNRKDRGPKYSTNALKPILHVSVNSDDWDGNWDILDVVEYLIMKMYKIRRKDYMYSQNT